MTRMRMPVWTLALVCLAARARADEAEVKDMELLSQLGLDGKGDGGEGMAIQKLKGRRILLVGTVRVTCPEADLFRLLRPLFRAALQLDAALTLDMEQYAYKDLTLGIFRDLLEETEFQHAPQAAMPQPNLVPVRPSSSRRTHSNGMSGSTSTLTCFPFTLSVVN